MASLAKQILFAGPTSKLACGGPEGPTPTRQHDEGKHLFEVGILRPTVTMYRYLSVPAGVPVTDPSSTIVLVEIYNNLIIITFTSFWGESGCVQNFNSSTRLLLTESHLGPELPSRLMKSNSIPGRTSTIPESSHWEDVMYTRKHLRKLNIRLLGRIFFIAFGDAGHLLQSLVGSIFPNMSR